VVHEPGPNAKEREPDDDRDSDDSPFDQGALGKGPLRRYLVSANLFAGPLTESQSRATSRRETGPIPETKFAIIFQSEQPGAASVGETQTKERGQAKPLPKCCRPSPCSSWSAQ
jgi:hypothetical protein